MWRIDPVNHRAVERAGSVWVNFRHPARAFPGVPDWDLNT